MGEHQTPALVLGQIYDLAFAGTLVTTILIGSRDLVSFLFR